MTFCSALVLCELSDQQHGMSLGRDLFFHPIADGGGVWKCTCKQSIFWNFYLMRTVKSHTSALRIQLLIWCIRYYTQNLRGNI